MADAAAVADAPQAEAAAAAPATDEASPSAPVEDVTTAMRALMAETRE